jgi:hypothetical protein
MKEKTPLLIAFAVFIGLAVVGGAGYFIYDALQAPAEETTQEEPRRRRIVAPVNEIPVSERPYVSLEPLPAQRSIQITLHDLKKPADAAEYEIEYQSGTQIQGAIGQIELGDLPSTTEILLGSCSAGGACTYHEDVSGGSLKLNFSGEDDYALEQDWAYIENTDRSDTFSSREDTFTIAGDELSRVSGIIYQSPGFPDLEGSFEAVSNAYAVRLDRDVAGDLTVSFPGAEDATTIVGWDGDAWIEFEATAADGGVSAEVPLLDLYLAVR